MQHIFAYSDSPLETPLKLIALIPRRNHRILPFNQVSFFKGI